jgi:acyl-[acyl-carrier-protein]-phospholipid O-acyltransferase/long-chain-fatty-acid--[acyl-carrier-protein] ligase
VGFAGGLFVVPLNAFLQERAGAGEKGRLLATNNFANMLGVILASGVLWLLHDLLHWNAGSIILALGIVIIAGTAYVVSVLPDLALRFFLLGVVNAMFRVRVEGGERIPRQGPALIAANHISFADAVMIGYATPRIIRFLMWRRYYDWPLARAFFKVLHAIPISLASPKDTVRAIRQAREELNKGELVGIFPEGHITFDGKMRAFERGFERIVDGSHAPIIPIHLNGLYGHPLSYKGGGLFRSWEHLFRPVVTVRVGNPVYGQISPDELKQLIVDLAGDRN